jgi:hypothetical protein
MDAAADTEFGDFMSARWPGAYRADGKRLGSGTGATAG